MKVGIYDFNGNRVEEIELPEVFETPIRPDLIRRAFIAAYSKKFTPYGKSPMAGRRAVAWSVGAGFDIARIRRIEGFGRAAMAANVVGGYRIRAPKPYKRLVKFINKKEKVLALKSAIAATKDSVLVQFRGHRIDFVRELPIIVVDEFENISKTRDVRKVLVNLGLKDELDRVEAGRRVRAGKGKRRGRKYKRKKGPLIIVSTKDAPLIRAARNLEGVDVKVVDNLSVINVAPGGWPARLCIWSKKAILKLPEIINSRYGKMRGY
ncbi:MAG: 50S ribosomal protein L4 [Crenarchaeota archaeon]|nr:50S ribosomal protein L4 [Thermoproteota archaeon]MCR8454816.1 50S ribosomal protein L4 [Thermoproteota archaeon]MCR8472665.1 50S ribosomal protein L4 [Thermoproteota archaeon]MCR8486809.1 50S ribosomal protein L4 [Thermoproteota archaeon]MCR8501601.1 50S ribosomal protein L4 [Thermoproteota archaeon]